MDDLAKISDLLNELQATADRRLELLREILEWANDPLYYNLLPDVLKDKIEKELSDDKDTDKTRS